jgi:hypothetical protein
MLLHSAVGTWITAEATRFSRLTFSFCEFPMSNELAQGLWRSVCHVRNAEFGALADNHHSSLRQPRLLCCAACFTFPKDKGVLFYESGF